MPETNLKVRFGLRSLILGLTVVSAGFAVLFATPSYVAIPLLLVLPVVETGLLTAGVVYCRGPVRAFCIGGLVPAAAMLVESLYWIHFIPHSLGKQLLRDFPGLDPFMRSVSAASWLLILFVGLSAMAIQRWASRNSDSENLPDSDAV